MEKSKPCWIPLAAVALLASAVYLRTLGFGFVFDDNSLIVNNLYLRESWSPIRTFAHHFWYGTRISAGYYRPIVAASLALNGRLLGWGPAGFHLVNLVLHALNSALVFLLARRLGLSTWAAGVAAALFAVHPAAAWPVSSVVARVDLLPALFVLLAWIAYTSHREPRRQVLLTGLFFLLAMLCKESALAFLAIPVLGLRSHWRGYRPSVGEPRERWNRLSLVCSIIALALYLVMRVAAQVPFTISKALVDPDTNPLVLMPLPARLYAALRLSGRYLLYLLFPIRFSDGANYVSAALRPRLGDAGVLLGTALILAWIAGTFWLWLHRRQMALPLTFSLLSFLPTSNLLMPIGSLYAQNFLYMPLVGLSVALGMAFSSILPSDEAYHKARPRLWPVAWISLPVLAALVFASFVESGIWRDGVSLFTAWSVRFPNYALAHSGLGVALLDRGDPVAAIAPLRRALEISQRSSEANYNLGVALILTAKDGTALEEALRYTRAALEADPDLVQARVNASKILLLLERPAEAEAEAREALRLAPGFNPARVNLAESLFRQSRYKEAAVQFGALVRTFPGDPAVRSPYIVSLIHVGDLEEARRAAEAARQAFPNLAWFDFCLARIEAGESHREAALTLLRLSLSKDLATRDWMKKVDEFKGYSPLADPSE